MPFSPDPARATRRSHALPGRSIEGLSCSQPSEHHPRLMDTHRTDPADEARLAAFDRLLADDGPRAALRYLNGLTEYRFTGVFRFEQAVIGVFYFDREQPDVAAIPAIPLEASYCSYVRRANGLFTTADAMLDPRLTMHPARAEVRGYCGSPVFDPEGNLLGTLCHFDVEPRDPTLIDSDLLQQAASRLGSSGLLTPAPG